MYADVVVVVVAAVAAAVVVVVVVVVVVAAGVVAAVVVVVAVKSGVDQSACTCPIITVRLPLSFPLSLTAWMTRM